MHIGPHLIDPPLVLAPMAGVSDKPFRQLCRHHGAGLAWAEMLTADSRLWATRKSRERRDFDGEPAPLAVQLLGHDPAQLAAAARAHADLGAQLIDINMGCPARKVCAVAAGSALLRDELRVGRILEAVVAAVDVPVTLKMRTGYTRATRNARQIARIAEDAGIAAITVHGRTREDLYGGEAEYETAAAVKAERRIPVIVNGDIDSAEKAQRVLAQTGCDGLMIGRAARGRPWLFAGIARYLASGSHHSPPTTIERRDIVLAHLDALYAHYGEARAVRIARKHLAWYSDGLPGAAAFRTTINAAQDAARQRRLAADWLGGAVRPFEACA